MVYIPCTVPTNIGVALNKSFAVITVNYSYITNLMYEGILS